MQTTAQAILDIKDPARRANTAIALFGTPIEDLSVDQIPQFLKALTSAEDRLGNVAGVTDDMADTLDNNAGKALQRVQRVIAGEFMGVLNDVDEDIIAISHAVTSWIDENPELAATLTKVAAGLAALVAVGGSFLLVAGSLLGPIAMVRYGMEMFGLKTEGAGKETRKASKGGLKVLGGALKWLGRSSPGSAALPAQPHRPCRHRHRWSGLSHLPQLEPGRPLAYRSLAGHQGPGLGHVAMVQAHRIGRR